MNSYLLTRLFYGELEKSEGMQRHCTPHHQALFFRIIQIQNQVGWGIKSFDLPTENTMFYSCIGSYKTYKKCLMDLLRWNLIGEVAEAKNQYQARKISLYTDKWNAFFTGASAEPLPEQDLHRDEAVTHAATSACSLHCQSSDSCNAGACPVNKTTKPVKEETPKPLKLKILKRSDWEKTSKADKKKRIETVFSSTEDSAGNTHEESPSPKEKKYVALKRNESSEKPKDSLARLCH